MIEETKTTIATPSGDFVTMEHARGLPRMLDSSRPTGGVNRIRSNPGGRLYGSRQTGRKSFTSQVITSPTGEISKKTKVGVNTELDRNPGTHLLVQHQGEKDVDFAFRSSIAAPRDAYWHSVEALAGRPFGNPVNVNKDAPVQLSPTGEWFENADLEGTSIRSMAARSARKSGGEGLDYLWVDYSEIENRPYVRQLDASAVTRVHIEPNGVMRMHVCLTKEEYENQADEHDASKFPHYRAIVMVFRDGDPLAETKAGKHASYQVYEEKTIGEGDFPDQASTQEVDGQLADRVSLYPHTKIPIVPFPTGNMSKTHFVMPPMMDAAQLDYLLLQITSNVEYATLIANTFMRFAKGLKPEDIIEWAKAGPNIFYATTSPDAEMKWVTLPAEALGAGMDLSQAITRSIEVAGLAPMLTRSPGDERATGQSIATARAASVAESYYIQWEDAVGQILTFMAEHTTGAPVVKASFMHDFGMADGAIEQGQLLTQLYLDPKRAMSAPAFWNQLRRLGIISEDVDMDALIAASEPPEIAIQKGQLDKDRAALLIGMQDLGHFSTKKSAEVLYLALKKFGIVTVGELSAEELAQEFLLGQQSKRNQELYASGQMTPEAYWEFENTFHSTSVDPAVESAFVSSQPGGFEE